MEFALVRGVDVSAYQAVTSWARVGEAVEFVIVKASEGARTVSDTWAQYWRAAGDAGILRGSYHFAHPANSATAEARHYVDTLKAAGWRSGYDLPPVLDIERQDGKGKAELTAWVRSFVREVDKLLGLKEPWLRCGVYTNGNYYRRCFDGPAVHEGRWLWIAAWPHPVGPWPTEADWPGYSAAMWQWTDRARVDGITGHTDANVVRLGDLRSLAPSFYGKTPITEEEDMPLTSAEFAQIRSIIRQEIDRKVRPGPGAQRIAGDYSPQIVKNGDTPSAFAVAADARARAIVRGLGALAKALGPTVEAAVEAALVEATVDVDVTVMRAGDSEGAKA